MFFRPMQAPTGGTHRHDGQPHRLLGAGPPPGRRQDQGERLQDDHRRLGGAPTVKVTDDIAGRAARRRSIAFALGPEDMKVEFVEVKTQTMPIQLHHVHFFGQQNTEMQAWYVEDVRREGRRRIRRRVRAGRAARRRAQLLALARRRSSARRAARSITSASKSRTSRRSPRSSKPTASSWIVPVHEGGRRSASPSRSSRIRGARTSS